MVFDHPDLAMAWAVLRDEGLTFLCPTCRALWTSSGDLVRPEPCRDKDGGEYVWYQFIGPGPSPTLNTSSCYDCLEQKEEVRDTHSG